MRITSVSLEHQQGYIVIEEPTLPAVIAELCSLLGIQKSKTTPYCPQSNGKVERRHQTLIRMIGKLPEQKKINWPAHLPEVLQAYNGTQFAITGYSPHHLMFGQRPRFPIDLYFPTLRGETENSVLTVTSLTSRNA